MSKFQRTYTLTVQGRSGRKYDIKMPLTLLFDCTRRAFGTNQQGTFTIYNLSAAVRNDLQYDNAIPPAELRTFELQAGYESEGFQPTIFKGNVLRALSYRDGPNIATEIQAQDGLIAVQQAQIEYTKAFPWKPETEMKALIGTMGQYGVTLGAIGSLFRGFQATRGVTFIGSVWDVLRKTAANQRGYACIDHQKVYMMAQNDVLVIPGALPQLDATTGLIGTPRRSAWQVDAEMLFEPRLQLMQQLALKSAINPNLNGTYIVMTISHRGIISGAKDGGLITALSLQQLPETINQVTPT